MYAKKHLGNICVSIQMHEIREKVYVYGPNIFCYF